jgi:hypothetical protein
MRSNARLAGLIVTAAVLTLAPRARAADAEAAPETPPPAEASASTAPARPMFFSLALERAGGVAYSSLRPTSSSESYGVTTFSFAGPAANPVALPRIGFDVYLANGLTIGAALGAGIVSLSTNPDQGQSSSQSARAYLFSPRVGYRIPLSPAFDLVPRGGFTLVGAEYTAPDNQECTFGPGGAQSCKAIPGDSTGLFAFALSLEALAAWRVTQSFNVLGGLAYDQVLSASGSSDHTDASGNKTSSDAGVGGRYLGLQAWLGLGGYF